MMRCADVVEISGETNVDLYELLFGRVGAYLINITHPRFICGIIIKT